MKFVNIIKMIIQRAFRALGWEIRRYSKSEFHEIKELLNDRNISFVLDVGANIGQFASSLRSVGYTEKIESFEPIKKCYRKLKINSLKDDKWVVHDRKAIGERDGSITLNISSNLVSSSILMMTSLHENSSKGSAYSGTEEVSINKLDTIFDSNSIQPFMLKIDTQGYENNVLDGAGKVLDKAEMVLLETSIAPLYVDQPSWQGLSSRLEGCGFFLRNVYPGFECPKTGRLLQMDLLFVRKN